MRLSFDWITLTNFRSFKKETHLAFDTLPYGAYFITGENQTNAAMGSNGAGKSTIFDAIMWALSGKTLRGLRGPDVRTWSASGQTVVELQFRVGKKKHVVKRTVNPNSLELDGREVSDVEIEKLLGIPFSIIPHTILLGQSGDLFFDLSPRAKMQLFSDVLRLERWDHRAEVAKERADTYESECATLDGACESIRRALEVQKANLKRTQDDRDRYEQERSRALDESEELFKEVDKRLQFLLNEQGRGILMVDGAETELGPIEAELKELRDKARVREQRMRERAIDIASREVKIASYQTMLKGFKEKRCPTCGGEMHDNKKRIADCQAKIDAEQEELYSVMLKRDANQRAHARFTKQIESLEEAKFRYKTQLSEGESIVRQFANEIAELKARKASCEKEITRLRDGDNPYASQLAELRKQVAKAEDDLETKADRKTRLQARIKRYRYWQKGFREIKLYVIDEILQELQFTANAMLDEFGMPDWEIRFHVEKETQAGTVARGLNIFIKSPDNEKQVKWEVWSGGEAQRLRIIGALSLAEVLLNHAGITPDLEILDEPTRGLSANGAQDLCDFLAERAQRLKRRVFLIDHLSRESSRFQGRLHVTRGRKGSVIDESGLPSLNSAA